MARPKKKEMDPTQQTLIESFKWMRHCAFHAQACFVTLLHIETIIAFDEKAYPFDGDHMKQPFIQAYDTSLFVNLYNLFVTNPTTHSLFYLLNQCDEESVVLKPSTKHYRKQISRKSAIIKKICGIRNGLIAHSGRVQSRTTIIAENQVFTNEIDSLLDVAYEILDAVITAKKGTYVEPRLKVKEGVLNHLNWLISRTPIPREAP